MKLTIPLLTLAAGLLAVACSDAAPIQPIEGETPTALDSFGD